MEIIIVDGECAPSKVVCYPQQQEKNRRNRFNTPVVAAVAVAFSASNDADS